MYNFFLCLFIIPLILDLQLCSGSYTDIQFVADADGKNTEFDLLIFTQRWPVTACLAWMETNENHVCTLPSPKEIWTIHGVWPTRFGTIGPAYCNSSAEFNIDELKPFSEQLQQFWINIEKGTPKASLWKHEWLKHGTCASVLPELDSENKYFGQGLSWLQQYSMSSVLQKVGIVPDVNYSLIAIHEGILSVLKKNPSIHCTHDPVRDEIFLNEIRICFNKSLELVDCDGVSSEELIIDYPQGKVITNCALDKPIIYPSVVPPTRIHSQESQLNFPFVNFYKLIQMIIWFTL